MSALRIMELVLAAVCAAACIKALCRLKHPFSAALINAVGGAAALGAVNLLAQYTGVSVAFNYGTSFAACVLGAPGVIALLILRPIMLI